MENSGGEEYRANLQIPVDLFVSKKQKSLIFTDASANLVFKVDHQSHDDSPPAALPHHNKCLLFDASGNSLISIRQHNGSWQGFRGDDCGEKDLIFRVERTPNTVTGTEFEVFVVKENSEDSKPDFKMKGCPFQRSCTIYKGNSIVAQTSLMHKLGIQKVFVPRNRFRVTIFPGFVDHAFIVALIIIFFDGRKFWI